MSKDIAERIVKIRKDKKLTQANFAAILSATRTKIASYELARVNFDTSFLALICEKFSVNEKWLLTGEGDMYNKPSTFSLDDYSKENNLNPLEIELIKGYMSLDSDVRQSILSHFKEIFTADSKIETTNTSNVIPLNVPFNGDELSATDQLSLEDDKPDITSYEFYQELMTDDIFRLAAEGIYAEKMASRTSQNTDSEKNTAKRNKNAK